ncbi:hypothetical protein SSX86_017818 [Deinandra increscens subsp. villosa]|uniref:Leucine-rich repeat-containing N-terminal plant-type domain-containing protein n=1 Tax=Deinandra increscens subsp. villosa TaxID=3103831 RepID=A0AAP0GW17_9ASTR
MGNHQVLGAHLIFFSILLSVITYTCLGVQNSTISCHEQERLALIEFKHNVKDDFKVLSSWVGTDCCSWKGVLCDGATGYVVTLHLRGYMGNYVEPFGNYLEEDYYLVGDKVNECLEELRHLKHLDLSGNNFQGSRIPGFIGSFKKLSYLNLSNAGFIGIIPHHMGNLTNLKVLDFSSYYINSNMLMSNDVAWVSGLSSLEHIDLGHVELFQATNVDRVLHMIPSLTYLSLRDCGLSNVHLGLHLNSSKILSNIEHLDLSFNNFEGQLPHFFHNMTSLIFLDLSSYNFSLSWNSVNILNMIPSLLELHLSWCGFLNAPFSPTYSNLSVHSNIQYLDLSVNSIEGRFPSELSNMTSLRVLDLSENYLNSSIPFMPNLLKLDVSFNNFENIELIGIWRQCQLKELSLSWNYFGGEMIDPLTNTSECSQYALEKLESDNSFTESGSMSASLGRLTNLRVLSLMSNSFTGPIPKALEKLRSLEVLNLAYNKLTGHIPTFLGKLTILWLSGNQFSGSIPESLGRLVNLTSLSLESNRLTGPIPTSLGRLASLQALSLSSNLLNGTIPFSVGQLTRLAYLDVSSNYLEGVVLKAHFANLTMLKFLNTTSNHNLFFNISHDWIPPFQLRSVLLGSCKIADGFPHWLKTQRKLEDLVLSNASLHGILPIWLRKMPIISYLDLSHNKLTGSLKNLPFRNRINEFEGIEYLFLQDNLFNGLIPRSMCKRIRLVAMDASRNMLFGNIPDCVYSLNNIVVFILSSNRLSGVLPSSLGNISSSLAWLKLNDNNFSGELPRDIWNLRFLKVLDLGNNEFSGNIPKRTGENLPYLMVLRLHKNNFTGRIPHSLCKCSYLQILDVAHNNLTGSIPRCFGELNGMTEVSQRHILNVRSSSGENVIQVMKGMNLEYTNTLDFVFNMDLSSNKLTGKIPSEITTLTLLVGLNLSHNHLSGGIPDNIGNMKGLNSLDFSDNQFIGMIPQSMGDLNFLSSMNLSYNNLSGRIPSGNQLQTLTDPSIYAGNMDLCGAPLQNNCSNHETPPITTSKNQYEDDHEPKNPWFYLDVMCGFATGFWGIIGVLWFKKQWRKKLFNLAEITVDKVFTAVKVRVSKIKKGSKSK